MCVWRGCPTFQILIEGSRIPEHEHRNRLTRHSVWFVMRVHSNGNGYPTFQLLIKGTRFPEQEHGGDSDNSV